MMASNGSSAIGQPDRRALAANAGKAGIRAAADRSPVGFADHDDFGRLACYRRALAANAG